MMKIRLAVLLVLMLGACATASTNCKPETRVQYVFPDGDEGLLRSKTDKQLHWEKKDLPLMVTLDEDVADWEADLKFSISLWNKVLDGPIFVYQGIQDTDDWPEKPTNGLIVVRRAGPNAYPHASLRWDEKTGHMLAAPIRLPAHILPQYRLRTMAHEMGHVLGLAHDPDLPESVMYPSVTGEEFEWVVTYSDRDQLLSWYNPDKLVEIHNEAAETSTISTIQTSTTGCESRCHQTTEFDGGTIIIFPR